MRKWNYRFGFWKTLIEQMQTSNFQWGLNMRSLSPIPKWTKVAEYATKEIENRGTKTKKRLQQRFALGRRHWFTQLQPFRIQSWLDCWKWVLLRMCLWNSQKRLNSLSSTYRSWQVSRGWSYYIEDAYTTYVRHQTAWAKDSRHNTTGKVLIETHNGPVHHVQK